MHAKELKTLVGLCEHGFISLSANFNSAMMMIGLDFIKKAQVGPT